MKFSSPLLASLCLLAALLLPRFEAANAQPAGSRVRGTIESVNGQILIVKARDGTNVVMRMAGNVRLTGVVPISRDEIKVGAYIGVTSVRAEDGADQATEVHVFPEAMRGTGEGSQPWDSAPNSTMTNGALTKIAGHEGQVLTVTYKGGAKQVVLTPQTVVVTFVPGERGDIRVGAHIIAATGRAADGALEATRISVGRDGLTPPM
ncbi:MAG: hypothetical protein J0G28_14645 [Afipia sp.]|nr:hypothetical protein [Afipia sp.]OJW65534.1 MAG: hypothetical protein BGO65_12480 [Afipia sp. 64-13]